MVSNVPLSRSEPRPLYIEGQPTTSDADTPSADVFWASPDYFRTLRIPLRRGRFLTDRDGVEHPPAALVSESFAHAPIGGTDPIGRRIKVGPSGAGPWLVIVGIVGDVRHAGLDREPDQAIYQPQAMNPLHYTRLIGTHAWQSARLRARSQRRHSRDRSHATGLSRAAHG